MTSRHTNGKKKRFQSPILTCALTYMTLPSNPSHLVPNHVAIPIATRRSHAWSATNSTRR